jgi:hypothetical protein
MALHLSNRDSRHNGKLRSPGRRVGLAVAVLPFLALKVEAKPAD